MRFVLAGCLALGMLGGCVTKQERVELAKAGIELAVKRVAEVVVDELVEEGFTPAEAGKFAQFLKDKADKIATRIWKRIERKDDE